MSSSVFCIIVQCSGEQLSIAKHNEFGIEWFRSLNHRFTPCTIVGLSQANKLGTISASQAPAQWSDALCGTFSCSQFNKIWIKLYSPV